MSKLHHYLNEDFKKEYQHYLKNPSVYCPYRDIDGNDQEFYSNLSEFLKKTLKSKEIKEIEVSPINSILTIKVKDKEDGTDIYLKSDQFGFSAPRNEGKKEKCKTWNGKAYPYARYLNVSCDDNKGAENIGLIEFVTECIYETRTIGGSFLWPGVISENRWIQSWYNVHRGAGSYIEDRVDITLYEIKCFYDVYSRMGKGEQPNILLNKIFNRQDDKEGEALYRWLAIFDSFEDYVEKLKFEPFVKEENGKYLILDMAKSDIAEKKLVSLDMDTIKKQKHLRIRKINTQCEQMSDETLKTLLNNVKLCTIRRSEAIENC